MDMLPPISQLPPIFWPAVLVVLTIVVFVHEFGHFIVARWCGVAVKTFSLGFGPEIVGFTDKKGTRWRLSWIPLGGYVKFIDDENAASVPDREAVESMSATERKGSFQLKSLPQRAAVVAAGPFANFLLAVFTFACVFTFYGERIITPRVDGVTSDGPALKAGFQPGDLVLSIDGRPVQSFTAMQDIVSNSAGKALSFVVERGGKTTTLTATPELKERKDVFGQTVRTGLLGITRSTKPEDWVRQRHNPFTSLWMGVTATTSIITQTFSAVGGMLVGRESTDQIGGVLRITEISAQMASLGLVEFVVLIANLSVSIGLINLFPIPMLDGGHLLFYAAEGLRGRPLSGRTQEIGFRIGLAVVLMLMIFATLNDLIHFRFL